MKTQDLNSSSPSSAEALWKWQDLWWPVLYCKLDIKPTGCLGAFCVPMRFTEWDTWARLACLFTWTQHAKGNRTLFKALRTICEGEQARVQKRWSTGSWIQGQHSTVCENRVTSFAFNPTHPWNVWIHVRFADTVRRSPRFQCTCVARVPGKQLSSILELVHLRNNCCLSPLMSSSLVDQDSLNVTWFCI